MVCGAAPGLAVWPPCAQISLSWTREHGTFAVPAWNSQLRRRGLQSHCDRSRQLRDHAIGRDSIWTKATRNLIVPEYWSRPGGHSDPKHCLPSGGCGRALAGNHGLHHAGLGRPLDADTICTQLEISGQLPSGRSRTTPAGPIEIGDDPLGLAARPRARSVVEHLQDCLGIIRRPQGSRLSKGRSS
jgi:hypothetical protein